MPVRAPSICACGQRVPHGTRCACAVKRTKEAEARRPSSQARGYTSNWRRESKAFLALPGNERCSCGCGRVANVVDHRIAAKGDTERFWDRSNWQAMNVACNSRKAVAVEGGFGRPIAAHPPGAVETFQKGPTTVWGPTRDISPNSDRRGNSR